MKHDETCGVNAPKYRWAISDGRLWFIHLCTSGRSDVWQAPPPWRIEADRVMPSLNCHACGLHTFIGPNERVDELVLQEALEAKLDDLLADSSRSTKPSTTTGERGRTRLEPRSA